eukprot:Skav207698  [mRNA]  locus=scaffold3057:220123:220404:- [translate_table: standard]
MQCHVRKPTPLEAYAKSLQGTPQEAPPLLFPMYTVPVDDVLQMTVLEPHEVLKSLGLLVEFEPELGKALLESHQWVGKRHPDPDFKQFSVLQP